MTVLETSGSALAEPATSQSSEPGRVASIVRPGEGKRVRAFGNEIEFMLSSEQTAGSLALGHAVVPVGSSPPPHVHFREDEMFLIIEGQYRVFLDGEWTEVGPGSVVYLPRGSVHTFEVVGPTAGRHWVITTPGGFERFFARCEAEVFSVPGPPDFGRLAAINAEFGYEFRRADRGTGRG